MPCVSSTNALNMGPGCFISRNVSRCCAAHNPTAESLHPHWLEGAQAARFQLHMRSAEAEHRELRLVA